jgi:predicted N-acetyltransferase YhbS
VRKGFQIRAEQPADIPAIDALIAAASLIPRQPD